MSELVKGLEDAGYRRIIEIEFEGDHYDVEALDKAGKKVDLDMDPITGVIKPEE